MMNNKVRSLIEDIEEYIKECQNNLAFEILLIHQNDPKFSTEIYENVIASDLHNHIKRCPLTKIKFPILYRILSKSENQSSKKEDKNFEKDKLDFYFKCLDHYGCCASLLFENIKSNNFDPDSLNTLVTKYSDVFDFQFINPDVIKNLLETQNKMKQDLITQEEEIKKQTQIVEQKNNEVCKLKKDNENRVNELKTEINSLKDEIRRKEEENQKKVSELSKQKNEKEKLENEIKSLKEKLSNLESQIQSDKIEQRIKTFEPTNDKGVISYIDENVAKYNKNIIYMYYEIAYSKYTKNIPYSSTDCLPDYFQYKDKEFVLIDFNNMEIEITSYVIKSIYYNVNCAHLKSWNIQISNDLRTWETIDEHSNSSELNGEAVIKKFNVRKNHFTRYCLLLSTDECYGYDQGWALQIDHIDFYGNLKTKGFI